MITVDIFREGGLGDRRMHSVPEHDAIREIRRTGPSGRTRVVWPDKHEERFFYHPDAWCLLGPADSRLKKYDDRGRIWFYEPVIR